MKRKGPGTKVLAEWDGKLLARLSESLKRGKRPALSPNARRNRREVVSIDLRGTLEIEMSRGMQVGRPLAKFSADEKVTLVLSVLREKEKADRCLAAFYLLAAGRDEEAEDHLKKGGKGADAVRAAFGPAARKVGSDRGPDDAAPAAGMPVRTGRTQTGAAGSVARDILALTGGRRTRIVWIRSTGGKGHPFGPQLHDYSRGWSLMVLDTSEGIERALIARPDTFHGPRITPTGSRVVWTEYGPASVYVADWDGRNRRRICTSDREILAVGTAEDPPGTEWAYVGEGEYRNRNFAEVWRYRIDRPSVREVVWNKTPSNDKWAFSRDGRYGASGFPWPRAGIARLPNGLLEIFGRGCVAGLAPDGSGRAWHMPGNHRGVCVYDKGGTNKRTVNLSGGPGLGGREVVVHRLGEGEHEGEYSVSKVARGRLESPVPPGFWIDAGWLWQKPLPSEFDCLGEVAP